MNPKLPSEKVFVSNTNYPRHRLKERIIKENLLRYECKECGQGPMWKGKKLVLQLDHKNGVNNDHRMENLRFLCPNCHTQKDTYAAKNIIRKKGCSSMAKSVGLQN